MSTNWAANAAPAGEGEHVAVLLAGSIERITAWSTQLRMDERMRVVSFATDPEDLKYKLSTYSPDALVLDAQVFPGPDPLTKFLATVQAATYVVLPQGTRDDAIATVRSVPSVTGVYIGDVPASDFAKKIAQDVSIARRQAPNAPQVWARPGASAGGIRVVCVWNRAGGVGKSTLAIAMALEAAQRGIKTLLVGLSVPDLTIPLHLGLKVAPNISSWLMKPNLDEGLRGSIQKAGDLDVIVGLQDALRERDLMARPEEPSSVGALAVTATYAGYGLVVFDTPAYGAFPAAISASNTWLLPALPTIDHVALSGAAYELVFKKMAGTHRVSPGSVLVALNRSRHDLMSPREWQEAADIYVRNAGLPAFPPIAIAIPDVPQLSVALNSARSPLTAGDAFASQVHKLNDMLLGAVSPTQRAGGSRFGPFRVTKKATE